MNNVKKNDKVVVINNEDNKSLQMNETYTVKEVYRTYIIVTDFPETVFPKTCFELVK